MKRGSGWADGSRNDFDGLRHRGGARGERRASCLRRTCVEDAMRAWSVLGLVGTGVVALAASFGGCATTDCSETGTCGGTGSDGGSSSGSSGGDGGSDAGIIAPPGCDLKLDPKEAAAAPCLDDSIGVFVSPTGKDEGNGKKAEPVKTLQQALKLATTSRPRIYVCGDETQAYTGPVVLTGTDGVSIYGGFECSGWGHKGGKSKIAVSGGGDVALDVDKAKNASFQDLVVEGPAEGAPNSIAARVTESTGVSFKRVKLVAGNGQSQGKAADGTTLTLKSTNPPPASGGPILKGEAASGVTAGATKTCTCEDNSTSIGGGGGGANGGGGVDGKPDLGGSAPKDGKGGVSNADDCATGLGHTGAVGRDGIGAASPTVGGIDGRNWGGMGGATGAAGGPGQGGGGGSSPSGATGAGGGGGCGGCGGSGGKGGSGGGGSIGLLVASTTISLDAVDGVSKKGGAGGAGGAGGGGGLGGSGAVDGCSGGTGGKGGKGGAGAGGAGGISVGIVYKGTKPTGADAITWTGDAAGEGGAEGEVGAGNAGPKGVSEKLYEVK